MEEIHNRPKVIIFINGNRAIVLAKFYLYFSLLNLGISYDPTAINSSPILFPINKNATSKITDSA